MKSIRYLVILSVCFLQSCETGDESNKTINIDTPDWSVETHSNDVSTNYENVFPQDKVQRLEITLGKENWNAILEDLENIPHSLPGQPVDETFDPIWVTCDLFFEGKQWYKVGLRVKGNSSLRTTYQSGNRKFSFKLDFDQYEETYPAIKNQRFFGFKQLNLNNNFDDKSEIREKIAGDLFREFGIPAAKSAFYQVYIDIGNGSQYFGLYTLVEEVDNTVITTQFASPEGNLYKPEGIGATFAYNTYNTSYFVKKTNEDKADWSDVKGLYDALHNPLRTSNQSDWRYLMNSKMDMNLYLKWLAANTVMQNWDTYGKMTHNYYLYNDPNTSKFVWIPWDNNEALQSGKMGGAINLDLSDVTNQWPMIYYVAADDIYFSTYKQYVKEFAETVFEPSKMLSIYDYYSTLIREYAITESAGYTFLSGTSDFDNAIIQLKAHVSERYSAALNL